MGGVPAISLQPSGLPQGHALDVERPGQEAHPLLFKARNLLPRGMLGALWVQGMRSLLLMRPNWSATRSTPAAAAVLVLVSVASGIGLERLFIAGGAYFHWPSLLSGWLPVVVTAWACWWVAGRRADRPGAGQLFALLYAQALPGAVIAALLLAPMYRSDDLVQTELGRWLGWASWLGMLIWLNLAQALVLWRGGSAGPVARLFAIVVLTTVGALQIWVERTQHWYPAQDEAAAAQEAQDFAGSQQFQQEDLERQAPLLQEKLRALRPAARGEPGGFYALTFAPYADEDVFRRESDMVASVMQERFGARGRTLQLVNHRDTIREWPWATALNLQRAIHHIAKVMKRDEDVLFIHLTSHGASNGELAASFTPLTVDPVTPQQLRRWLDEAGVRWRVISISACYSGSWLPALANEQTLVMTAADADHTSYGCGRRSELTFFGRAMFDEQLRQQRDFEKAHAAARVVIDQREKAAGKNDGYSNPQIRMGEAIRPKLAKLMEGLPR